MKYGLHYGVTTDGREHVKYYVQFFYKDCFKLRLKKSWWMISTIIHYLFNTLNKRHEKLSKIVGEK